MATRQKPKAKKITKKPKTQAFVYSALYDQKKDGPEEISIRLTFVIHLTNPYPFAKKDLDHVGRVFMEDVDEYWGGTTTLKSAAITANDGREGK